MTVFWSKIWIFLLALAAAAALTVSLALPRSAHKSRVEDERQRLVVACEVVNRLMEVKAKNDVELVGAFARHADLVAALAKVDPAAAIEAAKSPGKEVADAANALMDAIDAKDDAGNTIPGAKPALAIVTDARGRVVARVGVDPGVVGDVVAGRYLVDDALAGYLRDDVWYEAGTNAVFLVAASPVVSRSKGPEGDRIIGAAVLGWKIDKGLADTFVASFRDPGTDPEDRSIHLGLFAAGNYVTGSTTDVDVDKDQVMASFAKVDRATEPAGDCRTLEPFRARHGGTDLAVVLARLPGEVQHTGTFFAVYSPRPAEASFGGAIAKAKAELGGGFPWVAVIAVFVALFGVGVTLTFLESDRPLRRLQADAVRLGKGELERLTEEQHAGRFGSVARAVNIHVDKLQRDVKAARKDLDGLLGPGGDGALSALDLLGGTPMPAGPGVAVPGLPGFGAPAPAAPPPSAFKFDDAPPSLSPSSLDDSFGGEDAPTAAAPARGARPGTGAPPPPPRKSLDDDILAVADVGSGPVSGPTAAADAAEDPYFREVFDQFLELKKSCGESIAGLTFAKFSDKLRRNRDDLMTKTGCAQVKFSVYVKDGKATLKATPVKDA